MANIVTKAQLIAQMQEMQKQLIAMQKVVKSERLQEAKAEALPKAKRISKEDAEALFSGTKTMSVKSVKAKAKDAQVKNKLEKQKARAKELLQAEKESQKARIGSYLTKPKFNKTTETIDKPLTFIKKLLEINKLTVKKADGFTEVVKGSKASLGRYIVAFTNNVVNDFEKAIPTLNSQIELHSRHYRTITVGGWMDSKTGQKYIDVGSGFNSLDVAISMGKVYKQKAIWDNVEMKEISCR